MTDLTTAYVYNVTSKAISTIINGTKKQIENYFNGNFDEEKNGLTYHSNPTKCGNDSLRYKSHVITIDLTA